MISYYQAIILGLLQGVSELFPISSLGHSVILPKLVGWNIHQNDSFFLTFLVATHLATALVLLGFFWADWVRIMKGTIRSLKLREVKSSDSDAKLGWLLVVGTIPAGVLGLLLEENLRSFFASTQSAAIFLTMNGLLLLGSEVLKRKTKEKTDLKYSDQRIAQLSFKKTLAIGLMQSIALIPGLSRTGAAISGGLLVGLSHEDAARYSFLLATPVIGAAALLKLPELFSSSPQLITSALLGAVFAAVSGYLTVKFLIKYFQTKSLMPFAVYCLLAGSLISLFLSR